MDTETNTTTKQLVKLADILPATVLPPPLSDRTTQGKEPCSTCGGTGYLRRPGVLPGDPQFGRLIPCPCKAEEIRARELAKLYELSNLGRFKNCTFANFKISENNPTLLEAYLEATDFVQYAEGFLILSGPPGTGKTHLAAAIANYMMSERGIQAIFASVPDLLAHIRSTYSKQQKDDGESEGGYDEEFEKLKKCPFLVLDDLGAERSTDWAKEILFQLINYRYMHEELATIVTTNKTSKEFDIRIRSRLLDELSSMWVEIKAPDYRQTQDRREERRRRDHLRLVK